MIKQHKDKIFAIVMIITLGNIVYWTFYRIWSIAGGNVNAADVLIVVSGFIATWGILILLRQYNRKNKENKVKG